MKEARVLKYQAIYQGLNKRFFTEKPQAYKVALIHIRLEELQNRGAKMLKKGRPNSGGTQITFAPVESAKEYQSELERIVLDGKEIGMKFEQVKSQMEEVKEIGK